MDFPPEIEVELIKNAVAHALGKAPTFIFPPAVHSKNWHVILLTRTADIPAQLEAHGFTGVREISRSKTSYIDNYLVRFESYPRSTHPDIGRRVQFRDGGSGTVADYVARNPDITRFAPAWLILADTEKYLTPSGWYDTTGFKFVEDKVIEYVRSEGI